MKGKADKVHELVNACLNGKEDGALIVEGIVQKFGFSPEKIAAHKEEIRALLDDMPDEFHASKGGGMKDATHSYRDVLIARLTEPRQGIHEDGTEELKTWEQLWELCQEAAKELRRDPPPPESNRSDLLATVCKNLLAYRARNTSNFQLEKADDYFREMRVVLDLMEVRQRLDATHGDA